MDVVCSIEELGERQDFLSEKSVQLQMIPVETERWGAGTNTQSIPRNYENDRQRSQHTII